MINKSRHFLSCIMCRRHNVNVLCIIISFLSVNETDSDFVFPMKLLHAADFNHEEHKQACVVVFLLFHNLTSLLDHTKLNVAQRKRIICSFYCNVYSDYISNSIVNWFCRCLENITTLQYGELTLSGAITNTV